MDLTIHGLFYFMPSRPTTVVALIDGFNLYHAIADLGKPHYKWVDLKTMLKNFVFPHESLRRVVYFTAYATWLPAEYHRHRQFVAAQEACDVEVVVSNFKKKSRGCHSCGARWIAHEEKETDVAIGATLVDLAHAKSHQRCLVVSADSDLAPAIRIARQRFPEFKVGIVTPPHRGSSRELQKASGETARKLKEKHLDQALLPATVLGPNGNVLATRPAAYDPPS